MPTLPPPLITLFCDFCGRRELAPSGPMPEGWKILPSERVQCPRCASRRRGPPTSDESRQRMKEIAEKNRRKAPVRPGPAPLLDAPPPPKPFSEMAEREPGEDDDLGDDG